MTKVFDFLKEKAKRKGTAFKKVKNNPRRNTSLCGAQFQGINNTHKNKEIKKLKREILGYVGGKVLLPNKTEGYVTGVFPGEEDYIVIIIKTSECAEMRLNFLLGHAINRTKVIPNSSSRIKSGMMFPPIECLTDLPFNKKLLSG